LLSPAACSRTAFTGHDNHGHYDHAFAVTAAGLPPRLSGPTVSPRVLLQEGLRLPRRRVDLVRLLAEPRFGHAARLVEALFDLVAVLARHVLSRGLELVKVGVHTSNAPASATSCNASVTPIRSTVRVGTCADPAR